jgi:molybdenum cofactor cytidylyltransferase
VSATTARVAALVLAAGQSARMCGPNKLLLEIDGRPMLARVVDTILATPARPVLVVTGHQADAVRDVLGDCDVRFAHNTQHAEGIGASIRAGVRALELTLDGVLVCLGDLPGLREESVEALLAAFAPDRICVPVHDGRRGHPVLFGQRFLPELAQLAGDRGARSILEDHPHAVCAVSIADEGVTFDVDSADQLERARQMERNGEHTALPRGQASPHR